MVGPCLQRALRAGLRCRSNVPSRGAAGHFLTSPRRRLVPGRQLQEGSHPCQKARTTEACSAPCSRWIRTEVGVNNHLSTSPRSPAVDTSPVPRCLRDVDDRIGGDLRRRTWSIRLSRSRTSCRRALGLRRLSQGRSASRRPICDQFCVVGRVAVVVCHGILLGLGSGRGTVRMLQRERQATAGAAS